MRDREDRLRGFNRMVSHELKNRAGAAAGAVALLRETWIDETQRAKFVDIASTNLDAVGNVLDDLASLSRLDEDLRQQRNVRLGEAVAEVRRRLRDFARARGVTIEIVGPLPTIEVNAAAVELSLTNYISNAVKYSDAAKPDRWTRVRATIAERNENGMTRNELVVEVSDNGVGIPSEARERLFTRFYRAHADSLRSVEGTGLGLSIVRETIADLGGRTWFESTVGEGSVFAFALPANRSVEAPDGRPDRDRAAGTPSFAPGSTRPA